MWRLPADMKRFKELTTGHTVIMGRKTFESLPKGALPNRTNVVITGNPDFHPAGCETYGDLETAIARHASESEIFIIGGASIYQQALPAAEKLYITIVRKTFPEADVFFPKISDNQWIITEQEHFPEDDRNNYSFTFQTFIKKK
ncbi:MAG: dihydrofolate reductase [Tannerella sp.]|nr:dihydrofolate reductase [Tannerella sp.]